MPTQSERNRSISHFSRENARKNPSENNIMFCIKNTDANNFPSILRSFLTSNNDRLNLLRHTHVVQFSFTYRSFSIETGVPWNVIKFSVPNDFVLCGGERSVQSDAIDAPAHTIDGSTFKCRAQVNATPTRIELTIL